MYAIRALHTLFIDLRLCTQANMVPVLRQHMLLQLQHTDVQHVFIICHGGCS